MVTNWSLEVTICNVSSEDEQSWSLWAKDEFKVNFSPQKLLQLNLETRIRTRIELFELKQPDDRVLRRPRIESKLYGTDEWRAKAVLEEPPDICDFKEKQPNFGYQKRVHQQISSVDADYWINGQMNAINVSARENSLLSKLPKQSMDTVD